MFGWRVNGILFKRKMNLIIFSELMANYYIGEIVDVERKTKKSARKYVSFIHVLLNRYLPLFFLY